MSFDCCERARIADARRMAYSFFANVFSTEVTKDFIAGMGSFEAVEGSKLAEFVSSLEDSDIAEVTQDVRSEFCALFLNMSAHPVFTSESVYLSDNHIIMQEPRDQVVDAYRSFGVAVDSGSFDWPEDHISMEMQFMAFLCKRESELCSSMGEGLSCAEGERSSAEAGIDAVGDAQKAFFSEHLDRWAPLFASELSRYAETLFYKGIAEYLEEFLADERRHFGIEA